MVLTDFGHFGVSTPKIFKNTNCIEPMANAPIITHQQKENPTMDNFFPSRHKKIVQKAKLAINNSSAPYSLSHLLFGPFLSLWYKTFFS